MKNIIISLIVAVAFLAVSCDSFLDEQPVHNLILENSVTDFNGAKNILNGMYSTIQNKYWGGDVSVPLSTQAGLYDGSAHFYQMEYMQANDKKYDVWRYYYESVNAANAAIEGLNNLSVENYPSESVKTEMLAEAKCFRAWSFINIFWLYGHWWAAPENEYGIRFRTDMANLSNIKGARLNVGESYVSILKDLDEAILGAKSFSESKFLSKEAAQMIKAKLLLRRAWEGDYKEALTLVKDIKLNAPEGFQMEDDMAVMYENGWDSKEVLWARYLESYSGWSSNGHIEHQYSYAIIYNNKYKETADEWLKEDPRYDVVMGEVDAPETWDHRTFLAPVKLCHKGQKVEPNAKYTSYFLRYAELFLMESELILRTGGTVADALIPLNNMRAARTNPVLPALTAGSKDELMDILFREIFVEQFLENGNEYYASLRFMKNGKPWIYTLKSDVNFGTDQWCWPIPDAEIANNPDMVQNPGLK